LDRRILAVLTIIGILLTATVASAVLIYSPFFEDGSSNVSTPSVLIPEGVDVNGNKIEDLLEQEIEESLAAGNGTQLVSVVVLLNVAPSSSHTSAFHGAGGIGAGKSWQHALKGFAGRLPYIAISNFASRCPNLLLVQKDHDYEALMAYAAQQGRARPYVWDVLGYRGDPQSAIAISDSGIDDSHVNFGSYGDADFSKKIVGWQDAVGAGTTPYDDNGHGSHCAGIAAGSGFYSTDVDGRAVTTWSGQLEDLSPVYIYLITGFYVADSGSGQKITLQAMANGIDTLRLYYSGSSGDPILEQVASYSIPRRNREYTFEYNIPEGEVGYYHLWVHGTNNPYLRTTIHWPYDVPEDGYSAWTGVAPDAKLVGLKGLDSSGSGYTSDLVDGIDWAVANREAYHITVLSMSWGGDGYDAAVNTAVSSAVSSGIVCVTSAGNSGSGGNLIHSPGSNPYVITVAATSVLDSVTDYSSQGGPSEVVSSVVKPDIAAPGGSFYYVPIFSTDSNDQDADDYYADFYADDSAPMQGTSMAAPFIAGSAAVVAQALGGYSGWSFSDESMALQTKMLLLMTATETYPYLREGGSVSVSPTLDRGGKDVHEGYGRVNLDAAVEAAALAYSIGATATESFGASPLERKCWARNVYLNQGVEYSFDLTVPSGADYDLYLYNITGDEYGEPTILAQSTEDAVGGAEALTYTPDLSGSYYVVVKRAREDTGSGQFTLTSAQAQTGTAVHLLLGLDPSLATYSSGQSVTFSITIFNQLNPELETTATLTITGPSGYYHYDFQPITVAADEVEDYSFSWVVPDAAGRYVVEVSLVPAQLTAYDAIWIKVG
jgi:subtilisin family serine protease